MIGVTAHVHGDFAARARAAGMTDIVTKPVHLPDLMAALRTPGHHA